MWKGEILQANTSIDMQIHLFRRHISFKCSLYITNTWYLQENEKWHKNDMTYRRKGTLIFQIRYGQTFFFDLYVLHISCHGERNMVS